MQLYTEAPRDEIAATAYTPSFYAKPTKVFSPLPVGSTGKTPKSNPVRRG